MAEEDGLAQVTSVTSTSWLGRIGQAFAGVLIGFLLIPLSIFLLFWNEGRAIKTARGLDEGAGIVRSVAAERTDPANDGKLVYVTGMLSTGGPVIDAEFGVRAPALRLSRQVEMYVWKEETHTESRTKLGGGEERTTTHKYVREWSDKPIDSSKFKDPRGHTNPSMIYQARETIAPGTRLGGFAVPNRMLYTFGEAKPLALTDAEAGALQIRVNKPVAAIDGTLYVGRDPSQPAVGDMKISFLQVPPQTASVVAAQTGDGFGPYTTHEDTTVELISAGTVPAAKMFQAAQAENAMLTWILRAVGAGLMFVGFSLILGPLGVLGDVIPIVGDVIRAGAAFVGLLCTAAIAPLVIAVGWLWYRPLVGIAIIVVGGAATWGLLRLLRSRTAKKAAA
jgi:hypothetical protein